MKKFHEKLHKKLLTTKIKLVNKHCLRNGLTPFNPENLKSEYMLFKQLKKMKILFCAKTVLKKEYELFNNKTNNSEFKEVEFISKFVEMEPLNCLGSHSSLFKTGAVYVNIPALSDDILSKLYSIFLTMLFYAEDIKIWNE